MNQEIKKMLEQGKQAQNLLAVYRDDTTAEDFSGIPVMIGRELALFRRVNDFQADGWTAVRLTDLSCLEQMDDCSFVQRVVKGEHLKEHLSDSQLTAENWSSFFAAVKKNWDSWAVLDTVDEEGEAGFYLGRVTGMTANDLYFRPVLADGTPAPDAITLPFEQILTASVGGRYLEIYRRYCRK